MAYPNDPGIDCLTAHSSEITVCNTPRTEAVATQHNDRERQIAAEHSADYLDVIPWLCTDSVCPAIVDGLPTHRDNFHIGENYVILLARAFGNALGLVPPGQQLTAT
jgi:SGNH domain (fused to AT3 domains)